MCLNEKLKAHKDEIAELLCRIEINKNNKKNPFRFESLIKSNA